jgi:hypothetical protein
MIPLDANNPKQVAGASVIEADLGDLNRKLLIFGGTAIPQWVIDDDGNTYRETAVVNLRRTVLAVAQATVSVGLASIGNDDSTFLFAADVASLSIDDTTQELLLTVQMALQGSKTGIGRFSYQVVADVTTQLTGISGKIRWAQSIFDPSGLTAGEQAQLFSVTANTQQVTIVPGSLFPVTTYTPVAAATLGAPEVEGDLFAVPYQIVGAPYGQDLVVLATISPFFAVPDPVVTQVAGPNPVLLSAATPAVDGVDFLVSSVRIA